MSPQTVILGALVALGAVAPLPFGSAPQWAEGVLVGAVGGLLAVWGALVWRGSVSVVRPPMWFWAAAGLFLAVLGWAFAQSLIGAPAALRGFRSEGPAALGSVALDPAAGQASAIGVAACVAAFWLALQTGRDDVRAGRAFAALGLACAAHALYGLLAHFSGANAILWFPKTAYHDVVTGAFVNRNTFATHAGLGLLCLGVALSRAFAGTLAPSLPGRERVRRLVSEVPVRKALLLGAALLVGFAVLLSESRAGAVAAMLGLVSFVSIRAMRGGGPLRAAAVGAAALGAGLLFALLGQGLEQRLWSAEADWEDRRQISAETLDALRTAPLRGVGLGGFEAAHRAHRKAGGAMRIERAHNDYLQTALELGVPAAIALFASLVGLAAACARGALRRRRNAGYPAAGFAACVLVGAHSALDFSLRVPAVSLLFSLMLGLAVANAWRSAGSVRDSVPRPAARRRGASPTRVPDPMVPHSPCAASEDSRAGTGAGARRRSS